MHKDMHTECIFSMRLYTAAVEGALRLTEAGCAGCWQYRASSSTYFMPQKLLKVFNSTFQVGVAPCVNTVFPGP
jgi:hypothetical protein